MMMPNINEVQINRYSTQVQGSRNAALNLEAITDELLYRLIRSKQGDEQTRALNELVGRYYLPLRSFFARLTIGQLQDAEDLTQETFLRVIKFQGAAPPVFRAWIFTIGRNLAYDHFRLAANRHETNTLENLENEQEDLAACSIMRSAEELALQRLDAADLQNALRQIPLPQREVLILRFYHNMKLDEIAQIIACPPGTVKSRLLRGLINLKKHLDGGVSE